MEKKKIPLSLLEVIKIDFKDIPLEQLSSSTSTLRIDTSMYKPDVKAMIKAVSVILQEQMQEDMGRTKEILENEDFYFFSEEKYIRESPEAFDKERIALLREVPTADNIAEFTEALYECAQFR